MQAAERQSVRREDERLRRQRAEASEGIEVQAKRIGARLIGPHAHVGRDLGQDLIAGDEDAGVRAVQARVLRRVAEHGEGMPPAPADREHVALADGPELLGHGRHELSVVIASVAERVDLSLADAVPAIVVHPLLGVVATHPLEPELRHEPLCLRTPELHAKTTGQPLRIADVVRVEVRHEHANDRSIGEHAGEQLLPQITRRGEADARVHDGDAVPVLEEPEVDVVERERQRHPDPLDAWRNLDCGSTRGRVRPWMDESGYFSGERMAFRSRRHRFIMPQFTTRIVALDHAFGAEGGDLRG